jgi:predicted PurR-regulated permease PerM
MARDVGKKLQTLRQPVQKVTQVAAQVGSIAQGGGGESGSANGQSGQSNASNTPQQVHVQRSIFDSGFLSSTLSGTQEFLGEAVVVLILLYFMLASGDFFLRKMIKVLPRLSDKKRALKIASEMEHEISRYFLTVTIINACLGTAVGTSLYFIGMPAPLLWGTMAFVLNFIPYLGALTGILLTALVALISIDPISHALLAPGAYLLIAILEGNFITPSVMGRRFTLNTVVIFAWLVFWGWLWGVPGALIAVPMLSALKIFCDHIDRLHTLGEFLGNSVE